MLDMEPVTRVSTVRRRKLFRFEHYWVRDQGCEAAILEAWQFLVSGTTMFRLTQRIKQCRIHLLKAPFEWT